MAEIEVVGSVNISITGVLIIAITAVVSFILTKMKFSHNIYSFFAAKKSSSCLFCSTQLGGFTLIFGSIERR